MHEVRLGLRHIEFQRPIGAPGGNHRPDAEALAAQAPDLADVLRCMQAQVHVACSALGALGRSHPAQAGHAVRAHTKEVEAKGRSFLTPLENHEEVVSYPADSMQTHSMCIGARWYDAEGKETPLWHACVGCWWRACCETFFCRAPCTVAYCVCARKHMVGARLRRRW